MTRALALGAVVLAACAPAEREVEVAPLDLATYDEVHPVLEARCGTLDCHGDPGRPLRIHAEIGLRAAGVERDDALTDVEREDNVRALAAVDPGAPVDDSLVLTKPLLGGEHHVGGDLFRSRDEAPFRCLRGWLAGDGADDAVVAACDEAAAEVELPPPDPE
jgi:hypothetical protein